MVCATDLRMWARRDRKANRNLVKALRRPGQQSLLAECPDLCTRISASGKAAGNAHNAFARNEFRLELAKHLFSHLHVADTDFRAPTPVYHLTVIDNSMVAFPNGTPGSHRCRPTAVQLRDNYLSLLGSMNFVGMIEPAFYVSTEKALNVPNMICHHTHVLTWDIDEEDLENRCRNIRAKVSSAIPYTTSAHCKLIEPRDLRQMLWYVTKLPREQTQVWRRQNSGRFTQISKPLTGRNAVRLYTDMKDFALADLAIAGGAGRQILDAALAKSGITASRAMRGKMQKQGRMLDDHYYAL